MTQNRVLLFILPHAIKKTTCDIVLFFMVKCDIALFSFILSLNLTLTPRKTPPWEMKGEIDSSRVKLYIYVTENQTRHSLWQKILRISFFLMYKIDLIMTFNILSRVL